MVINKYLCMTDWFDFPAHAKNFGPRATLDLLIEIPTLLPRMLHLGPT